MRRPLLAGLLLLSLSACFESITPLLSADRLPFASDILSFQGYQIDQGAWRVGEAVEVRRTASGDYLFQQTSGVGDQSANTRPSLLRFTPLRSGFFVVALMPLPASSPAEPRYFYDLVYVDIGRRNVYRWGLGGAARSLRTGANVDLRSACSQGVAGVTITQGTARISSSVALRQTMLNCADIITRLHVAPIARYSLS